MFDIFNNTNKDIEEIDKLKKYLKFIVKKLSIEKGIFNIIFVDNEYISDGIYVQY